MALNRMWAVLAVAAVALGNAPVALSQDDGAPQGHLYSPPYMPQGHAYAPGDDQLPPINSTRSFFETQVDILQTEIYRRNYDQRIFESEMNRHDLRGGPLDEGPNY
jgi:hypothetical protein